MTDSGMYKDLKDAAEKSSKVFENIDAVASDLITGGEDKQTARKKSFELSLDAKSSTENLKKEITKIFGDISKDRTALEAAKLSLSNLFSGIRIRTKVGRGLAPAIGKAALRMAGASPRPT